MKPWHKSHMVWLNVCATVLGGLPALMPTLDEMVPRPVMAWAMVSIGIANLVLRALTTEAIGQGPPDA